MNFCAVFTGRCEDGAVRFGSRFALALKAMGLNICDVGEGNSGQ
jgi:hypothetical protein